MKKTLYAGMLLVVAFAVSGTAQTRWLSRYWDGCKPSCSWREHANNNFAKNCDRDGVSVHSDPQANSCAKDGGNAYTCWDQIPFVSSTDPNLAYGFGATNGASCGTCFEVTFDGGFEHGTPYATHAALRGKKVILMGRNTGSDVGANQIDFMVPGGGLGMYDCFSKQLSSSWGINSFPSALGERYGGFLAECEKTLNWGSGSLSAYQECLRNKCDAAFSGTGNQAVLRQGCRFYADFMMAANNPTGTVRTVACPAELTARYGGTTYNPPGGDGPIIQPPQTYTLNVARNPTSGGNVRVNGGTNNPGQSTHNANTAIGVRAVPASGYSFVNWTAVSGSLPTFTTGSATSDSIRFNIGANVNIRANFQATVTQYTLTVARQGTGNVAVTAGSTTTQNPSGAIPHNAGTSITVAATAGTGQTFQNWTIVSGTAPTGFSLTSASNTFALNANLSIRANFQQQQGVTPTTRTVQASVNMAGGSVTINGNPPPTSGALTLDQGASVTIAATVNTGYEFVNWTAQGGTSLPSGFNQTSLTNTFTLNSNVNVRANFKQAGSEGGEGGLPVCQTPGWPNLKLTATIVPANAGTVTATPLKACYDPNENVTLTVTPKSGFKFVEWEQQAGWTGTENPVTVQMWNDREVTFTFEAGDGGDPPDLCDDVATVTPDCPNYCTLVPTGAGCSGDVGGNRTDTTKVEAEDYVRREAEGTETCASSNNPGLCKSSNSSGITNIGWIANGNAAEYEVGIPRAGEYTMVFRIAGNLDAGSNSQFTVFINGVNVGRISGNTGDWDVYTDVKLAADVQLNAGPNTVRLEFSTPVNVDYFLLLGEPTPVSIRYSAAGTARARANVSLTAHPRGFTAALPSNHNFTSYRVIDLRGREIRRGMIAGGVTDLRVSNLNKGVFFLRLEGKGSSPLVFRAVTH